MKEGLMVSRVEPGSWAAKAKIERGDRIFRVDGRRVRDMIDLSFFAEKQRADVEVIKPDGRPRRLRAGPELYGPGGLSFAPLKPRRCSNRCVFCYIDQLPPGLRPSLYVKDEDYRFSFLLGNYVTLSHISKADIGRIKEQHLKPLYVSVHCTDEKVREFMLGKKPRVPALPLLKELGQAGIVLHTQVVLCPGINDGEHLLKTIYDLAALYPTVASIAVVPVGLTKYRQGLFPLEKVSKEYALDFLKRFGSVQQELCTKLGAWLLQFSDEFYLKGKVPFPSYTDYGDLPQLENGVGLIPRFLKELEGCGSRLSRLAPFSLRGTVVTGTLSIPLIAPFVQLVNDLVGCQLEVVPVRNSFFGSGITVTGLLTGQDLYNRLKGQELGQVLLVPDVMLRQGKGPFLDGWKLKELGRALSVRVERFSPTVAGFIRKLAWLARTKFSLTAV